MSRAKPTVSTTTTRITTTTTFLPVTVQDVLIPAPFWKTKPKTYSLMMEERRIVCSATTDKAEEGANRGKYQLNVMTAGIVKVPIEAAWDIVRKFETLPKVDERFEEVKYFPENQRLFLHMVAYGYHARMIMQMRYGESLKAREMQFESVEGSFKGMKGVIRLEETLNQKTEFSMTTDYASEKLPLPKILLGVGIEIVGSRVAAAMRTFIEDEHKKVKAN